MLKHDPTVEVGSGGSAGSVVRTEDASHGYPVPTASTLLSEPLVLVARVLLATVPSHQPPGMALLGMGSVVGQVGSRHVREPATTPRYPRQYADLAPVGTGWT
jgi:hypothetical protein